MNPVAAPLPPVTYLLDRFPSLTETFILREIAQLRSMGVDLQICALRGAHAEPSHREAEALRPAARYAPHGAGARLWARFAGRRDARAETARVLFRRSLRVHARRPLYLVRLLRSLPSAVHFAELAAAQGARRVHAHFAHVSADAGMLAAALNGIPFSFAVHAWDIYAQRLDPHDPRFAFADFVVACTEDGRQTVLRRFPGLDVSRVRRVHHGVPLPVSGLSPPAGNRLLAVGRLEPKKGFPVLLRACRLLLERGVDFECLIAGAGSQAGALRRTLRRQALAPRVSLLGALTQEQLAPLYRNARVFVLPCVPGPGGDRDGLPNVLLEAQAHGIPVVSTPVGGIPELVRPGVNGELVAAGNAEALAATIQRLWERPAYAQRLGQAGRRRVEQSFDIVKQTARLADLLVKGRLSPEGVS